VGEAAVPGVLPGFGARLALFYVLIEYGRPQYYVTPLAYLHFGIIAFVLGLLYLVFAKHRPIPPVGWVMILFIGWLAKSIPIATNWPAALHQTESMITILVGGSLVLMTGIDTVERLRKVLWLYAVLGCVLAVDGILNQGRGKGGFFTDENDLGMILATAMPIAYFYGATATTTRRRFLGYTGFVLCLIGLLASFSRGAFLGLVAVVGYIVVRSRYRVAAATTLLLAALLALPFVPPGYYREMQSIETSTQRGDTGETRLYMWGVAWKVFLHNPILGAGPNNYSRLAPLYEDPDRVAHGLHLWGFACHSTYFTILAESGIPGTVLWVTMVGLTFGNLRRTANAAKKRMTGIGADPGAAERARVLFGMARGLEGALIGFLVTGAFLTVVYYPNLWSLVALSAAARAAAETEGLLAAAPPRARGDRCYSRPSGGPRWQNVTGPAARAVVRAASPISRS
jgi:O-antigen ligase